MRSPRFGTALISLALVALAAPVAAGSFERPGDASAASLFSAEGARLATLKSGGLKPRARVAAPVFLIARPRGDSLALRSRPRGDAVARVGAWTEFGSPLRLGVAEVRGNWLGVVSTALPNGRLGWVRAADVHLSETRISLMLDLSRRRLLLKRGDRVLRRMVVGIGRPTSPTPQGRFAVTDKLANRWGPYYGCCIVALSAHQPSLPAGWTGGDRIAIHGTNNPASIGVPSSAGCPHAGYADMRALMRHVPLGAPVFVRA